MKERLKLWEKWSCQAHGTDEETQIRKGRKRIGESYLFHLLLVRVWRAHPKRRRLRLVYSWFFQLTHGLLLSNRIVLSWSINLTGLTTTSKYKYLQWEKRPFRTHSHDIAIFSIHTRLIWPCQNVHGLI